jgi:hypothetical protein
MEGRAYLVVVETDRRRWAPRRPRRSRISPLAHLSLLGKKGRERPMRSMLQESPGAAALGLRRRRERAPPGAASPGEEGVHLVARRGGSLDLLWLVP